MNSKKKRKKSSEKLLKEDNNKDFTKKDVEELDEEVVISKSKENGHKRIDPSAPSESLTKEKKEMIKCSWTKCEIYLESQGLLMAHMNEHKLVYQCDTCGDKFASESDLNDHIDSNHQNKKINCDTCDETFTCAEDLNYHKNVKHEDKEWNCEDCSFQASHSKELINHLKLKGHQPSQTNNPDKIQITHCYTCKEEFSSYWNLMNHRKQKHPSNRTCRYFLQNNCNHGVNCWYRHDEPMETDFARSKSVSSSKTNIKCNVCAKTFENLGSLKTHKKDEHSSMMVCQHFLQGNCQRSEEDCWFEHKSNLNQQSSKASEQSHHQSQEQVFREDRVNPFPPEQLLNMVEMMNKLCSKVENLELRISNLMKKTV